MDIYVTGTCPVLYEFIISSLEQDVVLDYPSWRNISTEILFLLQRCLDRLRESREKLKSRFRKIAEAGDKDTFIEDLMRAEWKSLRDEQMKQEGDVDVEVGKKSLFFFIGDIGWRVLSLIHGGSSTDRGWSEFVGIQLILLTA